MMEAEKNPFESVRGIMLENLERVGGVNDFVSCLVVSDVAQRDLTRNQGQ